MECRGITNRKSSKERSNRACFSHCSHSAEGEDAAAAAAAGSCSAESTQSFRDEKGRMQRERWKRSLACFLLPASFRLPLLSN